MTDGVIELAVSGTRTGTVIGTRTMGDKLVVAGVPVQVQYETFYTKPYNPFVHISVPVPDTASEIKP